MKSKTSTTPATSVDSKEVESTQTTDPAQQGISGRSVFAVDTSAAGIVVRTFFLAEDGRLLDSPAVFPNLGYALDQIDHLRRIVIERFEQAAQVGVQVIAANAQPQQTVQSASDKAIPSASEPSRSADSKVD